MRILISEIQPEIFRISIFETGKLLSFNHFLIRDEKPTLIHTGHQKSFETISKEVSKLIDTADLAYICFSHFEPDECGSIKEWLEIAPNASACIGRICDSSVQDVVNKPSKVLKDGEHLSLGRYELLFLETPHFPHNWEASLYYETKTKTLFSSDLATQRGFPQAEGMSADIEDIISMQSKYGYMAYGPNFHNGLKKISQLDIEKMATMHGLELDRQAVKELLARLEIENIQAMETVLKRSADLQVLS